MRIAFFSPLPPAPSGIADYSAALLEELRKIASVDVFSNDSQPFHPSSYDIPLYQIGNNPFHSHAYETALTHPGVVVLHEANLHHLICDLTIRRKNWDAYIEEARYNGGAAAEAYAQRVRALEVGPDYEGLPMLRRIQERSLGVIAHSRFVANQVRSAGFDKPIAVIPHGAWLPESTDRMGYRHRLGLDELTPLIGVFGFLKPYKRIAESLRAFRRLLRVVPEAKMILVGDPHPEFPLASLISGLDLDAHVRVLGFTPIDAFMGYLGACDIILNLRYPTVGESSGTLLRSLGLGKAVLVSHIGSFSEYPEDVVLKVPVDETEEDLIFEYLNALVSRPEIARTLGRRARAWVEKQCSWTLVARQYLNFLRAVADGIPSPAPEVESTPLQAPEPASPPPPPAGHQIPETYLRTWAAAQQSEDYLDTHLRRLHRTLEITPPGTASDSILEMGAYLQITPALKTKLGYGEVRGCYLGALGNTDHKRVVSLDGEEFECEIDLFNAEKDRFPYPDSHFSTVLCCELIEHLAEDPMFLMAEVNRVLKPGGHLVLTTPNIGSLRAISAILQGYHPGFFPAYLKPAKEGEEAEARHNREYTPKEIMLLFLDAGFEMTLLETGPFRDQPRPEDNWILHLMERYLLPTELRGDGIYAVGRKTGPPRQRYPEWLYN
ncbi:MAG TPA: glycosyltransferase [Bryobacteraceae bacterium]|nr:glycosyltransferase [Bryobacteraceae bacterium]